MYSDISWNNPKRGVMAPNKGPSCFAIAWDSAVVEKGKKKLLREVRQAGVWQGERAIAKLSPLQSTVWLTLLTSFYFFAVSLCFLPLSPTTMTGLRLFLLQVQGFAILWYP